MNLNRIRKALQPAALSLVLLCSCGSPVSYDLPAQPLEFDVVTFTNPALNTDSYASFVYNGRTYIPFGTPKAPFKGSDVSSCIGYITENGTKDENSRVLTLKADPDGNYLAVTDIGKSSLPTTVMRAIDTQKKEISVPACVKDEGYEFWK